MTPAVRAVNWKLVAGAAAAFWLLIGLAVARHARARSPAAAAAPAPAPSAAVPRQAPAPNPAPQPAASQPGGELVWFALAAQAEPRLIGLELPVAPGPFAARFHDPPPAPDPGPMRPAAVFRRALDRAPNRGGPPPLLFGRPTLGTHVGWEANPRAAVAAAAERDTLAVVFQVSGPAGGFFTGNEAAAVRGMLLSRKSVADALAGQASFALQKVEVLRGTKPPRRGGAAVALLLGADGSVLHAVPGAVPPEEFLKEVRWASALHKAEADRAAVREAHRERLKREYRTVLPFDATPRLVPFRVGPGPVRHSGVACLPDRAKAHAVMAMFPRAGLEEIVPVIWDEVLSQ